MGFAILPLIWTGWQALRRRLVGRRIRLAVAIGMGAAILQAAYVLLRLDQVTIISKAVMFSPLSLVAAFALSACGALIYLWSRSWLGKAIALLVATFISWAPMVFGPGVIAAINTFSFVPKTGAALYNYALGLLPLGSFLFTLTLYGLVLWYVDARLRTDSQV